MKWKNNLDEMQEQSLLKLEHNAFWLTYGLLLTAIIIQNIAAVSLESIRGEITVFFIISFYFVVGCLRRGIWDRHLKANFKTNFIGSLIAGLAVAAIQVARLLRNGMTGDSQLVWIAPMISGIFTAGFTFLCLSLTAAIYKKKKKSLESE